MRKSNVYTSLGRRKNEDTRINIVTKTSFTRDTTFFVFFWDYLFVDFVSEKFLITEHRRPLRWINDFVCTECVGYGPKLCDSHESI